jgi:hypothetical protein
MASNKTEPGLKVSRLARRDFLKLAGFGTGAALLSACSSRARLLDSMTATAPTPGVTPTPDPRKLCFVLWDHQLEQYNFKPRRPNIPLPQTCPLYSGARNPLTPEWQAYWRGILQVCNPGMSAEAFEASWRSLIMPTRAFTNHSNPEEGDFVMTSLTCGGATHEMVTGEPEGDYMRIYTLNTRKPPPTIPADADGIDITRHFFATTGTSDQLADGSYAVVGFPQFENCIVPLVSRDDADLIPLDRIQTVTNIMRPYNT